MEQQLGIAAQVFVTEKGFVGLGGYTIVDSAKVLGHENRNEHFENLPPGADWKDLVRSGTVEGFKIF
ncbi:hypothetical protein IQ07DRAFT_589455 [Pyrenochaeta sp. DS3sAY3a]|nr:hypothetical protein IQ07DRAFT_589455 [Pyrenochaeta sp. DS3sAY3a]